MYPHFKWVTYHKDTQLRCQKKVAIMLNNQAKAEVVSDPECEKMNKQMLGQGVGELQFALHVELQEIFLLILYV